MIAIIGERLKGINTPNSPSKYSGVFLTGGGQVEFKEDCLCDALWEALWEAVGCVLKRELEE